MRNDDENVLSEKLFEVVLYSFMLLIGAFFVNRFGGETWEILHPSSAIAITILISHLFISLSNYKDNALLIRVFIPLVVSIFVWHSGDFSNGIVNAFQNACGFKELLMILVSIGLSIFLTTESKKVEIKESKKIPKTEIVQSKSFNDIVGQEHVIAPLKEIAKLATANIRVGKENAPYAVLLFLGPTGVGKTEAARALAQAVYGSQDALIRFDMGQFADAHQANRFYGPPPGYVGYEQGGQLTRAVLKKPRSVILLDEVEKADPKIWDAFLPVFDEGYIVDGSSNQKVDMRQTIIVLTSNLLADSPHVAGKSGAAVKDLLQATGVFRPELVGRINEVLVFNKLSEDTIREILQRRVDSALWSLSEQGIKVTIEQNEMDQMVKEVQAAKFGVRQIDDVVRGHLRKVIVSNS